MRKRQCVNASRGLIYYILRSFCDDIVQIMFDFLMQNCQY